MIDSAWNEEFTVTQVVALRDAGCHCNTSVYTQRS